MNQTITGDEAVEPSPEALSAADVERFGPEPLATFRANLLQVEQRLEAACRSAGRPRSAVRLLAITKTVPAHILRYAWAAGIREFGENKIQEARGKHEALADLPIRWPIVGHLQTNKAKYAARLASEFHALDSLRLAEALSHRLEIEGRDLDVYVQVNTSGEASKYGLAPEDLRPFVEQLSAFPRLKPRGLMTLAIFSEDTVRVRACFQLLRRLRDEVQPLNAAIRELSMGMSGDYELAIAEGADVVRVGQAIFGKRPTPDGFYWPAG